MLTTFFILFYENVVDTMLPEFQVYSRMIQFYVYPLLSAFPL